MSLTWRTRNDDELYLWAEFSPALWRDRRDERLSVNTSPSRWPLVFLAVVSAAWAGYLLLRRLGVL